MNTYDSEHTEILPTTEKKTATQPLFDPSKTFSTETPVVTSSEKKTGKNKMMSNELSIIEYAKMLAASTMIPVEFQKKPANILIAIQIAQHHGLCPIMVMNEIYLIHNRPSLSGRFVLALLHSSPRFKGRKIDFEMAKDHDGIKDNLACRVTIDKDEILGVWISLETAKKEGWLSKPGSKWKTMPELMLRYRAATWFARLHAPEILLGFKTDDEMRDIIGGGYHQPHHHHHPHHQNENLAEGGEGSLLKASEILNG